METTTTPAIIPQTDSPPVETPIVMPTPPAEPPKQQRHISTWIVAMGIVIVILTTITWFARTRSQMIDSTVTPTPTATSSAMSNRMLAPIATESAFIKFEADLEALTQGIQNTQIQNQQLLPPRIDLPLGF